MQLSEFHATLRAHPGARLEFVFDDGETIPAAFHITKVGHAAKRFIDCGGTVRTVENVTLQAWVSPNDPDHRLAAGKLAGIIAKARAVLPATDLPVEVEYEGCIVSQYAVNGVEARPDVLRFTLADKHTDCLAREACGVEAASCGCGADGQCC